MAANRCPKCGAEANKPIGEEPNRRASSVRIPLSNDPSIVKRRLRAERLRRSQ